ncbi:MAG: SDR family oxidoreductase [Actinomycetota bacterium]
MTDLSGRHVLVVGGTGTIGTAVVAAASNAGARVTATGLFEHEIAGRDGDTASWSTLDITDQGAVLSFVDELDDVTDIVSAAAARPFAGLMDMADDDLTALVDSKLWGSFWLGRAAGRSLPDDGTLTYISGLLADYPDAAAPVAAVSAAVESLAAGLAVELAPRRVNCVSPEALGSTGRGTHAGSGDDVAALIVALITNPWMSGSIVPIHGAAKP